MRGRMAALAALVALAITGWPDPGAAQSVVAARHLRPGTVLSAADMLPGTEGADAAALIAGFTGMEVRRTIYFGRAVTPGDLGPPTVVGRNEIVTLIFRAGGLGIRTEGRALGAGAAGERIRVMNLTSRQTVHAVILGPGIVQVGR